MSLSELHSFDLAAQAAAKAADKRHLPLEALDFGVLGTTVPQRGAFYGLPWLAAEIGAPQLAGPTISQACATSARILAEATAAIRNGDASASLAIATDRVSNGPHIYYPNPSGMGGAGEHEVWVLDNFAKDPWAGCAMVQTAENVAAEFRITTAEQNELVLLRSEQYQAALANDRAFQRRYMVEPIEITDRKGRVLVSCTGDEGIRPMERAAVEALKPALPDGTVTYAGQTHPADGAAGMIVTSADKAAAFSQDPAITIEIVSFGQFRERKAYMPAAPIGASRRALAAADIGIDQVAAIKSHNPFAVNDIAFARAFGIGVEKLNNYGCSLIWGHPQGPTGLRAIIELIEELVISGGGYGLFQGCAAGDTGMAAVIKVS
ncbi:thiolase [Luminiphilus syltensis NOR5-1B]|uniref:Thiolase n=2 Tax=Luminiphilus TaxID=1341118 RepID=B8KTX3_9GAMM|nr:thiolase [Luminiphilus syltensis NOR5-1B]